MTNLSFPIRHLSIRVPWHDSGWDGRVCAAPEHNSACLKLPRIADNKDEVAEAQVAGCHFKDLQPRQLPPCRAERAAFMSPHGLVRSDVHPYMKSSPLSHGHFKPTPGNYPPYSAPALPFRWMLKDSFKEELREHYPLTESMRISNVNGGVRMYRQGGE